MVVPLPGRCSSTPSIVPQRRRVVVIGATEAGVSCAFHLGGWAMLIEQTWNELLQQLTLLMSGEMRLDTRVTAIDVHERRLLVSSGESFVYDKLVSALPMNELQRLILNWPARLNSLEAWRYWLQGRDVELLDVPTQEVFGDTGGQSAGKRVATSIKSALAAKYSSRAVSRAIALFRPTIVSSAS